MSTTAFDISLLDTNNVDLDAYFDRIGYNGPRNADLSTLAGIVTHHAEQIPFENLNPFLGRPVELDLPSLEAKLIHGRRGGYCFEHNLLLNHVLQALGFTTTGLAARVLLNRPDDAPLPPRGHMLIRVDLPEGPHIVDVGFGGQTLTGVLRLEPGAEQATPHEPFRLVEVDGDYLQQALVRDEWRTLYRFGLQEQLQSDYEVTNWYLSNHPESHFVTGLIAARALEGQRYALRGNELAVHELNGDTTRRTLHGLGELTSVLEQTFSIDLSGLNHAALAEKTASFW